MFRFSDGTTIPVSNYYYNLLDADIKNAKRQRTQIVEPDTKRKKASRGSTRLLNDSRKRAEETEKEESYAQLLKMSIPKTTEIKKVVESPKIETIREGNYTYVVEKYSDGRIVPVEIKETIIGKTGNHFIQVGDWTAVVERYPDGRTETKKLIDENGNLIQSQSEISPALQQTIIKRYHAQNPSGTRTVADQSRITPQMTENILGAYNRKRGIVPGSEPFGRPIERREFSSLPASEPRQRSMADVEDIPKKNYEGPSEEEARNKKLAEFYWAKNKREEEIKQAQAQASQVETKSAPTQLLNVATENAQATKKRETKADVFTEAMPKITEIKAVVSEPGLVSGIEEIGTDGGYTNVYNDGKLISINKDGKLKVSEENITDPMRKNAHETYKKYLAEKSPTLKPTPETASEEQSDSYEKTGKYDMMQDVTLESINEDLAKKDPGKLKKLGQKAVGYFQNMDEDQKAMLKLMGLEAASEIVNYYGPARKEGRDRIEKLEGRREKGMLGVDKQQDAETMKYMTRPIRALAEETEREQQAVMAGMGETRSAGDLRRLRDSRDATMTDAFSRAGQELSRQQMARKEAEKRELNELQAYQQANLRNFTNRITGAATGMAETYGANVAGQSEVQDELSPERIERYVVLLMESDPEMTREEARRKAQGIAIKRAQDKTSQFMTGETPTNQWPF